MIKIILILMVFIIFGSMALLPWITETGKKNKIVK